MADWHTVITERLWRGPATGGHHAGTRGGRLTAWLQRGLVVSLLAAAACASHTRGSVPAGTDEPDKFLFDKGTEALNDKKWLTAREFFKQVTETYTQSPYRPDAKLGIGDTYLGEGTAEALVLAINEFREFLSFYPTNARADYANPEQMNRYTWYETHDWQVPYPGDSKIYAPDDVPGAFIPNADTD